MVGSIEITFLVKPNFKLERLILGFGEAVTILRPENLAKELARNYSMFQIAIGMRFLEDIFCKSACNGFMGSSKMLNHLHFKHQKMTYGPTIFWQAPIFRATFCKARIVSLSKLFA